MKVELLELHVHAIIMNDLAIGETGIITNGSGDLQGHIVLRTYSGYIDLSDPEHTWPLLNSNTMKLERKEFKLVEVQTCDN